MLRDVNSNHELRTSLAKKIIMKFNNEQKEKVQKVISDLNERFDQLEIQRDDLTEEIQTLINELDTFSKNLGWKEKLFGGKLGGNKELANQVKTKEKRKMKAEDSLLSLNKKLKGKSERLKKEFSSALKEIDDNFNKLTTDRSLHFDLYQSSKNYKELLKKAHQGIIDALLFLSWDKLINHPEASEKLAGFKKETRALQSVVDKLRDIAESQPKNKPSLIELIQFQSKEVAMASFDKLLKNTTYYYKYSDKYLIENKKMIEDYREKAYKEIIG